MRTTLQIKKDLANQGYIWMPNYKDILQKVWSQMETYFDDDENVLSALWASFKRYDDPMIGIVFITTKRTFTLEIQDNQTSTQIRYLPFDSYSLQKIQVQFSKDPNKLQYVSLQNDSFGNGITFATPSKEVAQHFVDTLSGRTNGQIEILPDSDDPLLANNEKEQVIDENLEKAEEIVPHKFEKKHKEESIKEQEGWRKAVPEAKEKLVEIKVVPPKKEKPKKDKNNEYGSKWNNKLWLLWFLLPICFFVLLLLIIYLI